MRFALAFRNKEYGELRKPAPHNCCSVLHHNDAPRCASVQVLVVVRVCIAQSFARHSVTLPLCDRTAYNCPWEQQ